MTMWSAAALRATLARKIAQEFGGMSELEESFMTGVCGRDFINYIKVERDLLYDEQFSDDRALHYIEYLMEERPIAFAATVDEWFSLWALKWRQRVKLATKNDFDEELLRKIESEIQPFTSLRSFEEAKRFALGSLVKSREVCFTDTLSEITVKGVLYAMVTRSGGAEEVKRALERNPIILLNEITKRVKALSSFKGPVIAVRLERVIREI